MKTALISLLTFTIGLMAGLLRPVDRVGEEGGVRMAESVSKAPVPTLPVIEQAVEKPVSSVPTGSERKREPFAEWSAALLAGKLTDSRLRSELLDLMTAADPLRAWRMLQTSHLRVTVADVERVAYGWQEKDPMGAVTFGLKLTDPLLRPAFLRQVLTHWFLEKPQAFAQWFASQPQAAELIHHINWSNMVYRPGATTLEDLDSLMQVSPPYDSFPNLVASQFCAVWKQPKQRQAAMEWLQGLADSDVRDAAWKQLVAEVSKHDPQAAADMLEEIGDPSLRREASSTIAAHLAQADPKAALTYAAELKDEKARVTAWQSALGTWATNDVSEALEFLRKNVDSIAPDLLLPVAGVLAAKAPAEALGVAASFSGPERSTLIGSLMASWRNRFPLDAQKWLESDAAAILPAVDLARLRAQANASEASSAPSTYSTTVNGRRVSFSY